MPRWPALASPRPPWAPAEGRRRADRRCVGQGRAAHAAGKLSLEGGTTAAGLIRSGDEVYWWSPPT
jgi:hypothetical protein